MIDLVTANEFTFTPSAFIAAYIEQEEHTSVTESTVNGGSLDTTPKQVENINLSNPGYVLPGAASLDLGTTIAGNTTAGTTLGGTTNVSSVLYSSVGTANPLSIPLPDGNSIIYSGPIEPGTNLRQPPVFSPAYGGAAVVSFTPELNKTGILNSFADGPVTASGSLVDLIGQQVADTRTTSKTVVTAAGAVNTVVLVLSYGQFKAKCANAQTTVTLIYTRVSEYLNSLV